MKPLSWIVIAIVLVMGTASAGPLSELAPNPGFEEGAAGWGWQAHHGAQATYYSQSGDLHSGKKCLAFSNKSSAAPHVYGRLGTTIEVVPETEYELSVWVRGKDVAGSEGANHFTDWNSYQLNLPTGTFGWQKRSTTFKTKPGQYYLNLGLNIADRIGELAVDDISLRALGVPIKGDGVDGSLLTIDKVIGHNAPGYLGVRINVSAPATLRAVVALGEQTVFAGKKPLGPGENTVEWEWDSRTVDFGPLICTVYVVDGKGNIIASAEKQIEKLDSPICAEIDKVEKRFRVFEGLYLRCKARGIPLDYPTVARTTLKQFIPLAREDVQKGHNWRAEFAVKDFNRSIDEGMAEMQAYLKEPSLAPNARRYKTGKVAIDGISFVGDRTDSKGRKDRGPLFFTGYGHFGSVRRDMPKWPGYGVNIIQIEVGPSVTLISENDVNLKPAQDIAKVLDDAAKHNVRVDVLLSPHYFPQWALNKWPHLAKAGGHFIGYEVDAPEAMQVIEKFLRTVVPILKDKPALHSFCLSNEPVFNNTANADGTKPKWAAYLRSVHGSLSKMNERYGTKYAAFDDVPIPGNESYDEPQFYDYCIFNQERFAAWHAWMAGVIESMAPDVPVHSKMMSMALPHRFTASWGCDPELFGYLSDINGNDCLIRGRPGGGWAIPWHTQNMSYDLQRSLVPKPIFNSENHPTEDRTTYYVPPEHFRTAIWQGAIHGQGATTFWVWERCFIQDHDFYGNVMDRPGCAQAVGTTTLDLNRFAEEVTALQKVKAPVAIVFSWASITREPKYLPAVQRVYEALNFCGVKVDFISESQLIWGKGDDYEMIVIPEATRLREPTFSRLASTDAFTFVIGNPPEKDPYGKPFDADRVQYLRNGRSGDFPGDADAKKDLWPSFMSFLRANHHVPDIRVVDAATGVPVWGLEWLPAELDGRTIINMVNLRDKPVDVTILVKGQAVPAHDLLSLGGKSEVRTLLPMTPVLAEVR